MLHQILCTRNNNHTNTGLIMKHLNPEKHYTMIENIKSIHLFKKPIKPSITVTTLILLSSLYIALFNNSTFWSSLNERMGENTSDNILVIASFFMFLTTILYAISSLFSRKKSIKYFLIFIIILSTSIAYFIDNLGTVISYSMIQNVFETDAHEAMDLLNVKIFLYIFIYTIIPSIFIISVKFKNRSVLTELKSRFSILLILTLITSSLVYTSYKEISFLSRENRELRFYINPVYPLVSLYKYIKISNKNTNQEMVKLYGDSKISNTSLKSNKPSLLILVVGETARAKNFSLNGYIRNTTPELSREKIFNFSNTSSCGTATAESLPCMFSDIGHESFDLNAIRHRENLLDALNYAKIDVLWKENNSGCKGVCTRTETELMNTITDADLCNNGECYDEILLHNLDKKISEISTDTVIILHQQGSHGPAYYKRVPEKYAVFKPSCDIKAVQDCSTEEVINSYDNTILYTDYFLSRVINTLKNKSTINTAMIYMSDHGESLGENGVYLHGLPYFMAPEEQTHIPFIVWLSPKIQTAQNIDTSCLQNNTQEKYSHDNLLHSVLGLMNVETKHYKPALDVFSACTQNQLLQLSQANEDETNEPVLTEQL